MRFGFERFSGELSPAEKIEQIMHETVVKYESMGIKSDKYKAVRDNLVEWLTGRVDRSNPEELDLYDPIAIKINELFNQKIMPEDEAKELMQVLRHDSKGRDNYTTIALIKYLQDADLYQKEEEIDELTNKDK